MSYTYYWLSGTDSKSEPQKMKQVLNLCESVPVARKEANFNSILFRVTNVA
jgi:hypothetical protein